MRKVIVFGVAGTWKGLFHGWGVDSSIHSTPLNGFAAPITVAIIESINTGRCCLVKVDKIKFINTPDFEEE